MRRRAARQTMARVSLFPFLAVLICTMGALIMLLVVIASQARAKAALTTTDQHTAADEELEIQRELLELRISQLNKQREKTESDLVSQRRKLSHVEDHTRRLRDELAHLNATVAAIGSESEDGVPTERLGLALVHLKNNLADAKRSLDEARRSSAGANRSFAVIPFQGQHETRRRPLYIECRADAIIFQPEGIKLTEKDFQGPLGPGNPLAAGLRAAGEYLIRRAAARPTHEGEPYPLLLVRPGGILAYYVARASLKSWGSEFGYELIDDDWKLEFEPPDPQLAEIERRAVDRARTMQRQLARFAPRRYGRAGNRSFRVTADEPLLPDSAGFGGDGGVGGSGIGSGTGRGEKPAPPGRVHRSYAGPAGRYLGPRGSGGGVQGTSGDEHAVWPYDHLPTGAAGEGAIATSPGIGALGSHGGPTGRMIGPAGSSRSGRAPEGGPFSPAPAQSPGTSQEAGSHSGTTSSSQAQGSGSHNMGGMEGGTAGFGQRGSSSASAASGGSPQAGHESAGEASSNATPRQGVAHDAAAQQQGASATPIPSNPKSLAERRGRDWGLPEGARGAVALTRPIGIICMHDRLIVLSDDREPASVIRFTGRTKDSIDDLVSTVWDQVDGWGIAGKRMYWRPVLAVEVAPDGEGRFDALAALMAGSGLDVKKKAAIVPASSPPRPTGGPPAAAGGAQSSGPSLYR